MSENECIICGEDVEEEFKDEDKPICFECCMSMYTHINDIIITTTLKIRNMFNMIISDPPMNLCECRSTSLIVPFDFYTVYEESEEKYMLTLCCICRQCGNYKEIEVDKGYKIQIKSVPSYVGLKLLDKKEEVNYIG